MGYAEIEIILRIGYCEDEIKHEIAKSLPIHQFSYQIENKSLDARKKRSIYWLMRVGVSSAELPGDETNDQEGLIVKYKKRNKKVLVVGSGPAGIFSALLLQDAGFSTTVIDRGSEVGKRAAEIKAFESSGIFNPVSNYAFGEGGAGTFSDGKLTTRTKRISVERNYILKKFVETGAPEEITYMAHPHIGSDNLMEIVKNLRRRFENAGGRIFFETFLEDLIIKNGSVKEAVTSKGNIEADCFIFAPGHSSYETYRMLMKNGVMFRTKRFAIGSRVEHKQEIINKAQWGVPEL